MPKDYVEGGEVTQHSPSVHSHAQGASIVQVELGATKPLIVLLWLSAFVSAAAVIALLFVWHAFDQASAHVNVLQYDLAIVKAQLIEQGLYDPTSH